LAKETNQFNNLIDTFNIVDRKSYYKFQDLLIKNKITQFELCKIDSTKAEIDINKNQLYYFVSSEYDGVRYFESLERLPIYLKEKYKINSIKLLPSCLKSDSSSYQSCYEKIMHKKIKSKHGINVIEKSRSEVDSLYIYSNKNKIHSTNNLYSLAKIQITKEHVAWKDSISKKILKKIALPKNIIINKGNNINLSVEFIISKTGKAENIKVFSNGKINNISQIENQVIKQISKIKWKPIEFYHLKINTEEHLSLISQW